MYTKGQRVMATSVDSSSSTILSSGKNVRKTDLTAESVEHMWENRELMQQTKTQRQDGADMAFETARQKRRQQRSTNSGKQFRMVAGEHN